MRSADLEHRDKPQKTKKYELKLRTEESGKNQIKKADISKCLEFKKKESADAKLKGRGEIRSELTERKTETKPS